jgi:hypothetical protein
MGRIISEQTTNTTLLNEETIKDILYVLTASIGQWSINRAYA